MDAAGEPNGAGGYHGPMNLPSWPEWPTASQKALAAIDLLLARYEARRSGLPARVDGSAINENYRVETSIGPLFVRFHHPGTTLAAVQLEQWVMRWSGDWGIPVILPMAAADGRSIHSIGGHFLSSYPWRDLQPFARNGISAAGASVLGAMLGRLHATLAQFSDGSLPAQNLSTDLDTDRALAELSQVSEVLRDEPRHDEERQDLLSRIERQRALLEAVAAGFTLRATPAATDPR